MNAGNVRDVNAGGVVNAGHEGGDAGDAGDARYVKGAGDATRGANGAGDARDDGIAVGDAREVGPTGAGRTRRGGRPAAATVVGAKGAVWGGEGSW